MIDPRLFAYIRNAIEAGHNQDRIVAAVKKAGWTSNARSVVTLVATQMKQVRFLHRLSRTSGTIALISGVGLVTTLFLSVLDPSIPLLNQGLVLGVGDHTYYVATTGSDSNPGTEEAPFATIQKARDVIRAGNQKGATVFIRGGRYELSTGITFTADDSGEPGSPNIYRNYPGEYPIFTMTKQVALPPGQSGTFEINLASHGASGATVRAVYLDGDRQIIARTPNYSEPNFSEVDPYEGSFARAVEDGGGGLNLRRDIKYNPGDFEVDPTTWSAPTNARVFIYPKNYWEGNLKNVASLDTGNNVLSVTTDTSYDIGYSNNPPPGEQSSLSQFYVEGLPEFRDAPREWSQEGNSLKLELDGTTTGTEKVEFVWTTGTITLTSVSYVDFYGLDFSGMSTSGGSIDAGILTLHDSDHIRLRNLSLRNIDGSAVLVSGLSHDMTIDYSRFTDVRGSAVRAPAETDFQFFKALESANLEITNNNIWDVGWYTHRSPGAIETRRIGTKVRNNRISQVPRIAILVSGGHQFTVIEGNDVSEAGLQTNDLGAIYVIPFTTAPAPDWTRSYLPRGVTIRSNHIENRGGYAWDPDKSSFSLNRLSADIYLDDWTSRALVQNNILKNEGSLLGCTAIHRGGYNTYENNICYTASAIQGTIWLRESADSGTSFGDPDPKWQEIQDMESDGYNMTAWQSAFPEISLIPEIQTAGADGNVAIHNKIQKNITYIENEANSYLYSATCPNATSVFEKNLVYFGGETPVVSGRVTPCPAAVTWTGIDIPWATWQSNGFDDDSLVADPLFVNAGAGNFGLQAGSPALGLGFSAINQSLIGVQEITSATASIAPGTGTYTVGGNATVSWGTLPYYAFGSFRYRVLRDSAELVGWTGTTEPLLTLPLSEIGSYQVCAQEQSDIRNPLTGTPFGWFSEHCTAFTVAAAPPAPATSGTSSSTSALTGRTSGIANGNSGGTPAAESENHLDGAGNGGVPSKVIPAQPGTALPQATPPDTVDWLRWLKLSLGLLVVVSGAIALAARYRGKTVTRSLTGGELVPQPH